MGSLILSIDRNGRKRTYSYDVLNRETAENWLDAGGANIRTLNYSYDAVGHLVTTNDPDSKYTYGYDLVDRVKSVDNLGTAGVPNVLLNYSYDAVGNLLSVTDRINGVLAGTNAYTYDSLNRVTKLTQSGTGVQSKRVDMSYDAVNRLTGIDRYADLAGTSPVANSGSSYDAAGRLTNLSHKKGASTIASYGFAYDAANRITQQTGTDGTQDYSYDDTNQLTAVDHTTQADEAYSYDANGNRTNAGYGTGTDNRLLTDGVYNYTYDSEGNRTKRTEIATGKVTEYNWDYRNRLSSVVFKDAAGNVVKSIAYTYDVDDRRIGKSIDGVVSERYVYDGAQIALVFDGAGVQTHRYLYGTGVDQILADERGGSVVWALADNQGTVRDVVDENGTILNHISYDSFGKVVGQTNPSVVFRYGYTGREQDNETGLDYYRARYYDSAVGRFISEDPIGFNAEDANLYRYVGNSPVNATDPSGLQEESIRLPFYNPFTPLLILGGAIKAAGDQALRGGFLNNGPVGDGTLPERYHTNNRTRLPDFKPKGAHKYKDFITPQNINIGDRNPQSQNTPQQELKQHKKISQSNASAAAGCPPPEDPCKPDPSGEIASKVTDEVLQGLLDDAKFFRVVSKGFDKISGGQNNFATGVDADGNKYVASTNGRYQPPILIKIMQAYGYTVIKTKGLPTGLYAEGRLIQYGINEKNRIVGMGVSDDMCPDCNKDAKKFKVKTLNGVKNKYPERRLPKVRPSDPKCPDGYS